LPRSLSGRRQQTTFPGQRLRVTVLSVPVRRGAPIAFRTGFVLREEPVNPVIQVWSRKHPRSARRACRSLVGYMQFAAEALPGPRNPGDSAQIFSSVNWEEENDH
jgi:hypothetical protein